MPSPKLECAGQHSGWCSLSRPLRTLCEICAASYAGKVSPHAATGTTMFFMLKAFGAGVILATGFIHMWPDANESFSNSCLGKQFARPSTDHGTGHINGLIMPIKGWPLLLEAVLWFLARSELSLSSERPESHERVRSCTSNSTPQALV